MKQKLRKSILMYVRKRTLVATTWDAPLTKSCLPRKTSSGLMMKLSCYSMLPEYKTARAAECTDLSVRLCN